MNTRVVVMMSPEEVRRLREEWERFAPIGRVICPDGEEFREDATHIRLLHTLEHAWEQLRRLEEEHARLQLRLSP